MASNDSTAAESTLPQMLDCLWSLVENSADSGTESGYGDYCCEDYSHQHHLSRRTRPHMLAYFSPLREGGTERKKREHYLHITREEGTELKADHYKHITSAHSLSKVIEDSHRIQDLEVMLKGVAEVRNLQMKANAVKRVGEWRREQLKHMDSDKSSREDRRLAADACRKSTHQIRAQATHEPTVSRLERSFEAVQDLRKLHDTQREKWRAEREKWKRERENWKVTCQKLKDDASLREQQLRKLTMESQRWKAEFTKLATAESEGKDVAEVCTDLLEQLRLEQQNLDLRRRTGDWQSFLSTETPTRKLERSSDDESGNWPQSSVDKWKGKYSKPDVEVRISQQQLQEFQLERQRWQVQSARLKTAESESKKLQEMCRALLDQLEKQDIQIRCSKVELQKASKWHALAQEEINEQRHEIKRLNRTQVAECIVCMNEFGEGPDQQRAHWKDCNHANICYKCTKTLWSSNNRNCPTCKTPASSMPSRLPPKIYL